MVLGLGLIEAVMNIQRWDGEVGLSMRRCTKTWISVASIAYSRRHWIGQKREDIRDIESAHQLGERQAMRVDGELKILLSYIPR